jgi:lipopolysaccharide transport system permease protein
MTDSSTIDASPVAPAPAPSSSGPEGFVLTGRPAPVSALLRDAWRSRDLILILARKDFYVRYRRATFGLLWAAALPLLQALVLAFVVSKFANFKTGTNYTVYVLSGTVAWAAFSGIVGAGSTSVVDGSGLSTKIYFPRLVLPLTTVVTAAYGFVISIAVLILTTLVTGVGLGPRTFLLIPAALLTLVLAASCALVLSALHVYFRDVRYLVQAALLVWLYLTPVIYPLSVIGQARRFVEANPVTGVVEMFRAATVGADAGWGVPVLWTAGWCLVLVVVGLFLHRRNDRVFVDLL